MRNIALILSLLLFLSCSAFAYTDLGVLKTPKTLGYFLLSPTDASDMSSGLVYKQKQNEKLDIEASYTAYKSVYLFTKNITRLRLDAKYKLLEYGVAKLTAVAGPAIYYAPSVGAGLAIDAGGILAANFMSDLAAALALDGIFFSDGFEMDIEPQVSWAPAFWKNVELFAGVRMEMQMVGYAFDGSSGGKYNTYGNIGLRAGI